MNKVIYGKKVKGCCMLSESNVKHINKTHILDVANKVGLSFNQMELAWNNFVQSGGKFVDNRYRTSAGSKAPKMRLLTGYKNPSQKGLRRAVSSKEARKVLLEYLTSKDSLVVVANRHGIDFRLAYDWIKELSVSGTINGEMILNVKKYAKLPIIDVFYLYKHPNTKRASIVNLSETEKSAYMRVANVLLNYLPVKA